MGSSSVKEVSYGFLLVMFPEKVRMGSYNWWGNRAVSSHADRHCCDLVLWEVGGGTFWSRTLWGRREWQE
jgi:hypothetical protein